MCDTHHFPGGCAFGPVFPTKPYATMQITCRAVIRITISSCAISMSRRELVPSGSL